MYRDNARVAGARFQRETMGLCFFGVGGTVRGEARRGEARGWGGRSVEMRWIGEGREGKGREGKGVEKEGDVGLGRWLLDKSKWDEELL